MRSQAEVACNLIADASFEDTSASSYPNAATSPWFTGGEGSDGSFITTTDKMHEGSQSAKFTFYFDFAAFKEIDWKLSPNHGEDHRVI